MDMRVWRKLLQNCLFDRYESLMFLWERLQRGLWHSSLWFVFILKIVTLGDYKLYLTHRYFRSLINVTNSQKSHVFWQWLNREMSIWSLELFSFLLSRRNPQSMLENIYLQFEYNHIGCVIVGVLPSDAIDLGSNPAGHTKNYSIGRCG